MCVIVPSQEIADGGGKAEGKTVIIVDLVSAPVYLLACVCGCVSQKYTSRKKKTRKKSDKIIESLSLINNVNSPHQHI